MFPNVLHHQSIQIHPNIVHLLMSGSIQQECHAVNAQCLRESYTLLGGELATFESFLWLSSPARDFWGLACPHKNPKSPG